MSVFADRFSKPEGVYLLSHSVGLPPRTMQGHVGQRFFEPWETDPEHVWSRWLAVVDDFRGALGNLFNHDAANFCPQVNVSSAVTKILYSLPQLKSRPALLISEESFPSLGYVLQRSADFGFETKWLSNAADLEDPQVWLEHLTADVGLLLLTHVHSNTGLQIDVQEIVRIARERGVVTVVDTAQSNGVVPIDFQTWNADFVVGSCVKWLCGGPGAGFLWVNPDIAPATEPKDVGWFSHADPFEFDIHRFRYAEDALRFWGGTPSIAPLAAAAHAISVIAEIGVDNIRAHNLRLSEQLLEVIEPSMVVSPLEPGRRGGTLVVDLGDAVDVTEKRLRDSGVSFDSRIHGIRLSPHIYNTSDEIATVARCLAG